MFNSINFKKVTATGFLAVLLAETLLIHPAKSSQPSPVGINQLYTTDFDATRETITVKDRNNEPGPMDFGTGDNIKLTGFQVAGQKYSLIQLVDEARFQRVDNDFVQGERHIFFLQNASNNDNEIASSFIDTMEEAVRSEFINIGTDNVFANQNGGSPNYNNIERVDFLVNNGLIVEDDFADNAGFLLLERGGNDPVKIAAITAVDDNGNPSEFGNLLSISNSTWGTSGVSIVTSVFQTETQWIEPYRTERRIGNQNIKGIFVSIASLGITSGQTIYGYAVFPYDIDADNDLVGLYDFPLNTASDSNKGGLDLISSGGLFVPEGYTFSEVFTTPPQQVVVYAD